MDSKSLQQVPRRQRALGAVHPLAVLFAPDQMPLDVAIRAHHLQIGWYVVGLVSVDVMNVQQVKLRNAAIDAAPVRKQRFVIGRMSLDPLCGAVPHVVASSGTVRSPVVALNFTWATDHRLSANQAGGRYFVPNPPTSFGAKSLMFHRSCETLSALNAIAGVYGSPVPANNACAFNLVHRDKRVSMRN